MLDRNLFEPPARSPLAPGRGAATTTPGRVRLFETHPPERRVARLDRAMAAPRRRRSSLAGTASHAVRPSSSTGRLRVLRSAHVAPLAAATLVVAAGATVVGLQRPSSPQTEDVAASARHAQPPARAALPRRDRRRAAARSRPGSLRDTAAQRGSEPRRAEARRRETPARRDARRRDRQTAVPPRGARVERPARRATRHTIPLSARRTASTAPAPTAAPQTATATTTPTMNSPAGPSAAPKLPEAAHSAPSTSTSSASSAGAARSSSAAPSPEAREFGIE